MFSFFFFRPPCATVLGLRLSNRVSGHLRFSGRFRAQGLRFLPASGGGFRVSGPGIPGFGCKWLDIGSLKGALIGPLKVALVGSLKGSL